jgi:hypothetical protein
VGFGGCHETMRFWIQWSGPIAEYLKQLSHMEEESERVLATTCRVCASARIPGRGGTRLGQTFAHLHEETRKRGTKHERRCVRRKMSLERWIRNDAVQQPTEILDDGDRGDGGQPR